MLSKKMLSNCTPENCERRDGRSLEDQDILERSTKKTKRFAAEGEHEDMEGVEGVSEEMVEGTQEANEMGREGRAGSSRFEASYRNILAGLKATEAEEKRDLDMMSDDEKDDLEIVETVDCPLIKVSKDDKVRIRKQFKQSLIIKVLGRKVGYTYLLRRLNTIWHPKSKMELTSMANDYFLVKFNSMTDYEFAKYGGPWMIMEHYLIVKEWRPDFEPHKDTTEKVLVWVRFPDLPLEYFDADILFRVGEKIGKPIRMDSATSLISKGNFARLCVEVDITKPLLSRFWLRKKVRTIEYEGIHMVCFKCGIYGHNEGSCNSGGVETGETSEARPEKETGGSQLAGGNEKGKTQIVKENTQIRQEITEPYGPWMIANMNTRGKNQGYARKTSGIQGGGIREGNGRERKENKEGVTGGSRFIILSEENQEEVEEELTSEEMWANRVNGGELNGPASNVKSKGKRTAVQVNEKQVLGNNEASKKTSDGLREARGKDKEEQNKSRIGPNRAAAAEEHVVIHGKNNGEIITEVRVSNHEERGIMHGIPELDAYGHFSDPPSRTDKFDLNFSVNDNGLFEVAIENGKGTEDHGPRDMAL